MTILRALCLLCLLAACSREGAGGEAPGPGTTPPTEVIVTADGVVECVDDGIVSSADLRGC